MPRILSLLSILGLATAAAQDGAQLYTLYCGACHAPDGMGATGGQFPPLAGSKWVEGDPARSIKIVLHGMQGPVEVKDKTYNLVMPPQGAVLPDDQIAAILTHVRSSWGNKSDKVEASFVKKVRAASEKRNHPWTAAELLKQHPLPRGKQYLQNLTSKVYKGKWDSFPDFDSLEAEAIEEEQEGLISLEKINHKNHFGVVWEGELMAHKDGDFKFALDADDEARLILGGKEVVKISGAGPMGRTREGRVLLRKGSNPFRLEYRQIEGQTGISLEWSAGGLKPNYLSEEKSNSKGKGKRWPEIPIQPENGRTATYRNFIEGTTPRAIAFGFPGGVNIAYSAEHMAPELVWTGAFMDGGRHWSNRGQGNQPPAGDNLIKLTGSTALPEGFRFRGYETDGNGNPTFITTLEGSTLRDGFLGKDGKLTRTLANDPKGKPIEMLLVENLPITKSGDGSWKISQVFGLTVKGATIDERDKRLFLTLPAGATATLTYDLP